MTWDNFIQDCNEQYQIMSNFKLLFGCCKCLFFIIIIIIISFISTIWSRGQAQLQKQTDLHQKLATCNHMQSVANVDLLRMIRA